MADVPLRRITLTEHDAAEAVREAGPAGHAAASELMISDDREAGIYEGMLDGMTAAGVVYTRSGRRITLMATSVFPQFRGQGVAGVLLTKVLDEIRANGDSVTITCPFAARFVAEHPEYSDLTDAHTPGTPRHRH